MSFFGPPPEFPDPETFEPPPWGPPIWDRPAEDTLGISLGMTTLLALTDELALVLDDVKAFPNGFSFGLVMARNPNLPPETMHGHPMPFRVGARVGFTFADGSTVSSDQPSFPPMRGMPFSMASTGVVIAGDGAPEQRGGFDADGVPTGHVLRSLGGSGGGFGFTHGFWCFRLPPVGPMTIHADMPRKLDEVSVELDATPIVEAAERSRILWPEPLAGSRQGREARRLWPPTARRRTLEPWDGSTCGLRRSWSPSPR